MVPYSCARLSRTVKEGLRVFRPSGQFSYSLIRASWTSVLTGLRYRSGRCRHRRLSGRKARRHTGRRPGGVAGTVRRWQRRASEVITLRLECLGRYDGLAMLWHDQTEVGEYDQAIRIPEALHAQLSQRQRATLAWFADQHGGRHATAAERSAMALFRLSSLARSGGRGGTFTRRRCSWWIRSLNCSLLSWS